MPVGLLENGECIGITVLSVTLMLREFTPAPFARQIQNHIFIGLKKLKRPGGINLHKNTAFSIPVDILLVLANHEFE